MLLPDRQLRQALGPSLPHVVGYLDSLRKPVNATGKIEDLSGRGNNGTLVGTSTVTPGNGWQGNGSSYVTLPYTDFVFNAPVSFLWWSRLNFDHRVSGGSVYHLGEGEAYPQYVFLLRHGDFTGGNANELLTIWVNPNTSIAANHTVYAYEHADSVENEWHMYGFIATGAAWKVVFDGNEVALTKSTAHGSAHFGEYCDSLANLDMATIGAQARNTYVGYINGDVDKFITIKSAIDVATAKAYFEATRHLFGV